MTSIETSSNFAGSDGDSTLSRRVLGGMLSPIPNDPLAGGMPYWRYFGNRFLTWMMNVALGLELSEYHSGFRAFRVSALRMLPFMLNSDDYHFDSELIIQFALAKMRMAEVAIPTHYGKESQSPTVRQSFAYGANILLNILMLLLHKWGIVKQQKFDLRSYTPGFIDDLESDVA